MTTTGLYPSIRGPAFHHPVTRARRQDALCIGAALYVAFACAVNATAQLSDPLVLSREVFTYVTEDRRDPFLPPGASMTGNPMVGGVRLLGIIHHPQADLSVVLLESGEGSGAGLVGGHLPPGVRLRVGESVGDARIAEIHVDHVALEIASPSGVTRRIIEMPGFNGRRGS